MGLDPRNLPGFDPDPVVRGADRDADLARRLNALERALGSTRGWVPGDVKATARAAADAGWLVCDGTPVSRTTYAALFAAIGTAYGAGDGASTFNLPNLQGAFPMGVGSSGTTGATSHTRGQRGGQERVKLVAAEGSTNGLGTTNTVNTDHLHSGTTADGSYHGDFQVYGDGGGALRFDSYQKAYIGANGAPYDDMMRHSHTFGTGWQDRSPTHAHTLNARDADNAHDNLPPFTVLNYVVKT